jgi:hypothetical protein
MSAFGGKADMTIGLGVFKWPVVRGILIYANFTL